MLKAERRMLKEWGNYYPTDPTAARVACGTCQ